jgi:GntR family transcriptional regulator, transcriptional repressor for pyruvate dehydrogenase complex
MTQRNNGLKRRKKIGPIAAREILKDAQRRGLGPGSRLAPESEMLQQMDVGRGSLREALRILEVHGLLSIRPGPGGGPVLTQPSSRDFGSMSTLFFMAQGTTYREVIEARVVLHPLIARLAAERAEPDFEERLMEKIAQTETVMDTDDQTWLMTATEFDRTLVDLAGNSVLATFASSIQDIYHEHVPRVRLSPAYREKVTASHKKVAHAIGRGDGKLAERVMRQRMEEFVAHVTDANPTFLDETVDWE